MGWWQAKQFHHQHITMRRGNSSTHQVERVVRLTAMSKATRLTNTPSDYSRWGTGVIRLGTKGWWLSASASSYGKLGLGTIENKGLQLSNRARGICGMASDDRERGKWGGQPGQDTRDNDRQRLCVIWLGRSKGAMMGSMVVTLREEKQGVWRER